ncbi:MAG: acetyl/propionyl-CoA carboxylase subunit alpha, partial [Gammaproteobacteria bacterium]
MNERECSIQRRHQKVVEEAPSPFVDDALRQAMGAQAIDLARAVNYVSAGTVEFIVDAERKFYFLEMNTRLQVEHPVTEKITGIDLVEWMLRIAAGEKLTLSQHDVGISGWSLETRIYAEDPFRGFMPSSGRVTRFRPPEASETVRIDTGLYEGAEVSLHYDPMVAKLISHGPDRDQAADTMRRALDQFEIRGIQANTAFLTALIESPRFRAGETTTAFIEEEFGQGFTGEAHAGPVLESALAVVSLVHELRHRDRQPMALEPERVVSPAKVCRIARIADQIFEIALEDQASGWSVLIGTRAHRLKVLGNPYDSVVDFEFDGYSGSAQIRRLRNAYEVIYGGSRFTVAMFELHVAQLASIMPKKIQPDRSHLVLSPMPGLLVSLSVNEGDNVKA